MISTDIYDAIQARYGFAIPPEYRRMEADGCFELKNWGVMFDPDNEPTYLWIPEVEWLKPGEILAYRPEPEAKPGFVPFAFTGAGDHWCWWPDQDPEAIVLCLHDEGMGSFDAPHFLGSLYRRCLDYALDGISKDDESEARRLFDYWVERLGSYLAPPWIETLRHLSRADRFEWRDGRRSGEGFLTPEQYNAILARDLSFPRLGEAFEWILETA